MNSNVVEITNHVQAALGRLLQQYQNRPRFAGIITALVAQVQDFENGFFPVNTGRQLSDGTTHPAIGAQLDGIGQLVGIARNGVDDATYLVLILGTIAENNSETTYAELLYIVQTIFEASEVFIKTPNSSTGSTMTPAWIAFSVQNPQLLPTLFVVAQQIIKNSIGAGISLMYLAQYSSPTAFSMDGSMASDGGFGDLNDPTAGAPFASLIYSNSSE